MFLLVFVFFVAHVIVLVLVVFSLCCCCVCFCYCSCSCSCYSWNTSCIPWMLRCKITAFYIQDKFMSVMLPYGNQYHCVWPVKIYIISTIHTYINVYAYIYICIIQYMNMYIFFPPCSLFAIWVPDLPQDFFSRQRSSWHSSGSPPILLCFLAMWVWSESLNSLSSDVIITLLTTPSKSNPHQKQGFSLIAS